MLDQKLRQADAQTACLEDFLRRGLPLVRELAELAGKLEGNPSGRIREIAAELTELFDPAQVAASLEAEAGQVLLPLAANPTPGAEVGPGYQHVLQNQQIDVGSHEAA